MPRNCSLISSIFQKKNRPNCKMKYFADDSAMEFKFKFFIGNDYWKSQRFILERKQYMFQAKLSCYHRIKNGK